MLTTPGGNVRLMTQRVLSIANLLVGNTAGNPRAGRSSQSPAARTNGWTIRELQGLDDIDPHRQSIPARGLRQRVEPFVERNGVI